MRFKWVKVSRIGGDEFAIILIDADATYVSNMIKSINEDIIKFNESSIEIIINMAIGFAVAQHSLNNMNLLFSEADKRMYKEKKSMKSSCS